MPTRRRPSTPNHQLPRPSLSYQILEHALPGATRGEHARAAIARTMLIKLLWETGTLSAPFERWAAEPAVATAIRRAEDTLTARAQRLGLPSAVPLRDTSGRGAPQRGAAADRALQRLHTALETTAPQRLQDATAFIYEQLPWRSAWLAEYLLVAFELLVELTIYGAVGVEAFIHDVSLPAPAPALSETFVTGPHETVAAALRRWGELDDKVRAALAAAEPAVPRGRMPAHYDDPETSAIAAYVHWLVRRELLKESVHAIANAVGTEPANIRRGIADAKAALA
jgi:hypothetical protein